MEPLSVGQSRVNTLKLRRTAQSWYILTIPFNVVPGYDVEAARREMDDDSFRREICLDWTASGNRAVFSQWRESLHVAREPLDFNPEREIHLGWDPAYTGTPAFAITQINPMGQWQIFPPVCPPPDVSVGPYEFGCMVADHLQREYATPYGLDLDDLKMVHIGDPWGRARVPRPGQSKKEAASFYDILKRGIDIVTGQDEDGNPIYEHKPGWGWKVIPGAVNITERLEAVRSRLTTILPGGYPGLVVDPRASLIIRSFGGLYAYKDYGDGNYSREPNKGYESNIMDAIGYIATRLFAKHKPIKERDEDDDDIPRHEFRSMASGRYD
jgi:hypothetical protein